MTLKMQKNYCCKKKYIKYKEELSGLAAQAHFSGFAWLPFERHALVPSPVQISGIAWFDCILPGAHWISCLPSQMTLAILLTSGLDRVGDDISTDPTCTILYI